MSDHLNQWSLKMGGKSTAINIFDSQTELKHMV